MAAELGSGHLWGGRDLVDDEAGGWAWVRMHRLYCTVLVAIVVVTLYAAQWSGQPSPEVGTTSSSPSVTLEAPPAATD